MAVGVDPQRRARVAEVTERAGAKMASGLRGGRRSIPAESAGGAGRRRFAAGRSEEHTSELQSRRHVGCRLLLEKKKRRKRGRVTGRVRGAGKLDGDAPGR